VSNCAVIAVERGAGKTADVGLDGRLTGEVILAHANALGCDLLIKGAYTQSRLRQMLFGGTTRYILSNAHYQCSWRTDRSGRPATRLTIYP
jgi:nucleotide-binding universal stress UspA family protein